MNFKIYQYVPMSKPKALSKMIPRILKENANVILDIEDSVQDTLNPKRTKILKKEARDSIPNLIDILMDKKIDINDKLYIRINSFESGELEKDILIVKNICNKLKRVGLFTPMIRNLHDLIYIKELLGKSFNQIEIVPIIETVEGYNNLKTIVLNSKSYNIKSIHYGHYDYSLDSRQWPFLNQNESLFWNFIIDLKDIIENENLKYIHTPVGQLSDENLYKQIIKKLKSICKSDFGVTALNYNQVLYSKDLSCSSEMKYNDISLNDEEKMEFAKDVVDIFENNQCSKRSFSVDIKKAKFLTPHEYKMAKLYMKEINQ